MHMASMHKTLVFTAFSPLCTTDCARMWNKTRCHKRPCQFRRCPKHWYLPRFASLYDIPRNNVEQDTLSQASMPLATMPKTLVFFHVFASLYNILRKDVEEEKLSQASMPLAEVRSHLTPKPPIQETSKYVVVLLFFGLLF